MEDIWSIVVIVGPLLLLAASIYAWVRNKRTTRSEDLRSDRGTRNLREKLDAEQVDPPGQ